MSQYFSIKDITKHYAVGRTTIYRLLHKGHLKAVKIGSATRISKESLDAYFASLPEAQIRGKY